MPPPSWPTLDLPAGVLREAVPEPGRLILWLPGPPAAGFRPWARLGTIPGAPVQQTDGLCAIAATVVATRQRLGGWLATLLGRWRRAAEAPTWLLPDGSRVEQVGERQTDWLLVWPADAATPLDEAQVRACWPQATRSQRLGRTLFLVGGIALPAAQTAAPGGSPLAQAEQALAAARRDGDGRRELAALTDLGIAALRDCAAGRAVAVLEEALTLARRGGDPGRAADVLCHLGLAVQAAGDPRRGLDLLAEALASARAVGDAFGEKTTLEHLGLVHGSLRAHVQALAAYEEALTVARAVGDRRHEAELFWALAVQHAELGERAQALAHGEAAVELFARQGHPQTAWLASHLQRYCQDQAAARFAAARPAPAPNWSAVVSAAPVAVAPAAEAVTGPGLLRMAFTALRSMARFLGSGAQTVSAATHRQRVASCAGCPQHTGLRCRVCGCFTNLKAWLPHEQCPLGKWPA